MKNNFILFFALTALVFVSKLEAKGGRGGGRGGRGGSRGGSHGGGGWSFFGGSKKSSSSSGSSKSGSYNKNSAPATNSHTGGWFQGLFHSSPYHYSYRPVYIGRSYHSPSSNQQRSYGSDAERDPPITESPDNDSANYAVGYTISKALSNDFFSLFNVVHDISKYPKQIENTAHKMSLTSTSTITPAYETTTEVSVPTYEDTTFSDSGSSFTPATTEKFHSDNFFGNLDSPITHLGDFNKFMQSLAIPRDLINNLDSTTQKIDSTNSPNHQDVNTPENPSPEDLEKDLHEWIKLMNRN